MSLASAETLVEQRVAQLEAISVRRNELLRQMYHMMRRRNNVGAVVDLDEVDDGELQSFLQRFDIGKDLDMGSITNLNETELFLRNQLQPSNLPRTPSPTFDRSTRRATRSQSRFTSLPKSPSPTLSKQAVTPPLGTLKVKSPEVQELNPDAQVGLDRDKLGSSGSSLSDDEKQEGDTTVKAENPSSVHSSTPPPLAPPEVTEEAESTIIEVDQEEDITKANEEPTMQTPTPIQSPAVESIRPEILEKLPTEDSDADMANVEDAMEVGSEEEVSRTVDRPSVPPLHSILSPSSKEPIKSSIPFMHLGPSSPLPATPAPRLPIIVLAPEHPAADPTTFTFEGNFFFNPDQPKVLPSTLTRQHHYNPDYALPSLKTLPSEFNRKVKTKSRRREKDKERDKDNRDYTKKDDWFPMGINKWAATLNANPVWKRVSRPTKCLSSREWGVAIIELKLIRTFDRIESLKDSGRWSFRQPKKQRGVGGLVKTHWDHLMDEMKWMRIDFREERRWKMALAHTLATAVMEWHAAGSLEERVLRGICVLWTPSHVESDKQDQDVQGSEESHETTVPQELQLAGHTAGALLGVDLGLDAEEIDQPSVVDVLQPQAMLEDTLEVPSQGESPTDQEVSIKLKTEEIDDAFALQGTDELINQSVASAEGKDSKANITGLKSTSRNPILGTKANSNSSSNNGDSDTPATSTRSSLKQVYSPLRERLMESEIDQLFLDLDDFHITLPSENQDDSMELGLPPADLSIIFPELQTLSLSDIVTPSIPVSEGKKKAEKRSDRDDPSKRTEDTTYTKLFPIGQFMHTKPTLIGPLQPSKNWRDGKWLPLDEPPIHVDYDGPTRPPENYMSDIFDNRLSNSTVLAQQQLMLAAARERDRDRKRTTEQQWSVNDDTLLKCLIDRFPYNWQLISESFNATRVTAPTDKRTARDCFERWREKWAPEGRRHPEAPSQTAPAPAAEESTTPSTSPMTTRGVKRLASSMAGNPIVNAGGSEPKKRRRHILLQETIRKSVKKKAEFQQKMLSNQRKPSSVHDTHLPFNTMRYYSPAELSRMKADKDTKATQEVQLRRRQEEVARANIQARLTPAQQQSLVQQQQQLQQQLLQQQQQQQQNQQPQQPGTPAQLQQQPPQTGQQTPQLVSTPTQSATNTQSATPQVSQPAQVANIAQRTQNTLLGNQTPGNFRGQINISRINSPNIAAGVQRLTTQQILQLQQARSGSQPAQVSQGAHQLGQQGHIIMPSLNGNGTTLNSAHLTTSFVNRDSTSSPAHLSPPRKSATPTNINSPRITTDQVQHGQVQIGLVPSNQGTGNTIARPQTNLSYIPGLTHEHLSAIRLQLMQQGSTQQDGSTPTQ